MRTKLSTKGQVVLPIPIRRKMGLEPGDLLDIKTEAGRVVLIPRKKRSRRCRIVTDPTTGLPVLTAGPNAPTLTSEQVREALYDFP